MTLVMSIPCNEGLLLCADKRIGIVNGEQQTITAIDDANKIHKLDRNVAFIINGYCIISKTPAHSDTEITLFDANAIIKKFFATNSTARLELNFPVLAKKLKESYKEAIEQLKAEGLADNLVKHTDPKYHIYQVIFFTIDMEKRIRVYELTVTPGSVMADTNITFRERNYDPFAIKAQAFGFFYVCMEIEKGNDLSFNVYRENPVIKRLLMNFEEPNKVSKDEAVLLAKEIFAATYNRYLDAKSPLSPLERKISPISRTMDIVLLSFNRGFRLLEEGLVIVEDKKD